MFIKVVQETANIVLALFAWGMLRYAVRFLWIWTWTKIALITWRETALYIWCLLVAIVVIGRYPVSVAFYPVALCWGLVEGIRAVRDWRSGVDLRQSQWQLRVKWF